MIYTDCHIVEEDLPVDDLGHPLSEKVINGAQQHLVFEAWRRTINETDALSAHYNWANIRHPSMLCKNVRCVNPEHMRFGRYSIKGTPELTTEEEYKQFKEEQIKRGRMSDLKDLRPSPSEMSDEELLEAMRKIRLVRRGIPAAKQEAKANVQREKTKESIGDMFSGLTDEQKAIIIAKLTE